LPVKSLYSRFKRPVPESFVFGTFTPERDILYGCYSQAWYAIGTSTTLESNKSHLHSCAA